MTTPACWNAPSTTSISLPAIFWSSPRPGYCSPRSGEMIHEIMKGSYVKAMVHLLDRVLLALMLAEIIYTVGRITRTQQLETEPFLIVGIIAAIRRMLIITAESAGHVDLTDPFFQAILAELALLSLIILMLAWAMRLIRNRE